MCGIVGIWNCRPGFDAEGAVGTMLDAMQHRGPDGRGTLSFDGGAAGMVRLALVDLSPRGMQPIWSADDRVAILFNGEIYNFRAERDRLIGKGVISTPAPTRKSSCSFTWKTRRISSIACAACTRWRSSTGEIRRPTACR